MRTRLTAPATLVAAAAAAHRLSAAGRSTARRGRRWPPRRLTPSRPPAPSTSRARSAAADRATEVDLQLQGQDAAGTLSLDGHEIELLTVDDAVYVQAPLAFWTSFGIPDGTAAELENRWVIVPADAAAGFQTFTLAGFVAEVRSPDGEVEDEVSSTEVDGDDAVVVSLEDGSSLDRPRRRPLVPARADQRRGRFLRHAGHQRVR